LRSIARQDVQVTVDYRSIPVVPGSSAEEENHIEVRKTVDDVTAPARPVIVSPEADPPFFGRLSSSASTRANTACVGRCAESHRMLTAFEPQTFTSTP
jgi:hypothetical protein